MGRAWHLHVCRHVFICCSMTMCYTGCTFAHTNVCRSLMLHACVCVFMCVCASVFLFVHVWRLSFVSVVAC